MWGFLVVGLIILSIAALSLSWLFRSKVLYIDSDGVKKWINLNDPDVELTDVEIKEIRSHIGDSSDDQPGKRG